MDNEHLKNLYKERKELIAQGFDPLFSKEVNDVEDEIVKHDICFHMGLEEVLDMISEGKLKSIFDPES